MLQNAALASTVLTFCKNMDLSWLSKLQFRAGLSQFLANHGFNAILLYVAEHTSRLDDFDVLSKNGSQPAVEMAVSRETVARFKQSVLQ